MSGMGDALAAFKAHLETLYPTRVVTRDFKNLEKREHEDLLAGIYTVAFQGFPRFDKTVRQWVAPAASRILVLGQFVLDEGVAPSEVENAELMMADEIMAAVRSAPIPMFIDLGIGDMVNSVQQDAPYGWVAATLELPWIKTT